MERTSPRVSATLVSFCLIVPAWLGAAPQSVDSAGAAQPTQVVVVYKDGRESPHPLAEVARIEFRSEAGSTIAVPPPAPRVPRIAGLWEEVDGHCAGTRWEIFQNAETVWKIIAKVRCRGGESAHWQTFATRWQDPRTLVYTVTLSDKPTGWLGTNDHVLTLTGEDTADVMWRAGGSSGTVKLRRLPVC